MAASGKWEIQVLVACVGFAIVGKTAFLLTVTVSQAGILQEKGMKIPGKNQVTAQITFNSQLG